MSQLYHQSKKYLWEVSRSSFYGWLTLGLWVVFSVFNLGMVIGVMIKYLKN